MRKVRSMISSCSPSYIVDTSVKETLWFQRVSPITDKTLARVSNTGWGQRSEGITRSTGGVLPVLKEQRVLIVIGFPKKTKSLDSSSPTRKHENYDLDTEGSTRPSLPIEYFENSIIISSLFSLK